jgi:hypothetical protein
MPPDLVWEPTDENGKLGWQLVEVTCPWALIDHNGETLEKAHEKKVGKYDQSRPETSETYPGRPVTQSSIVVSATGSSMKKSLAEFAQVMKLEGRNLAPCGQNVVDAAIRG